MMFQVMMIQVCWVVILCCKCFRGSSRTCSSKQNNQCRGREAILGYSGNGMSSWSGVNQPSGGGLKAACVSGLKKGHFQFSSMHFSSHGVVKALVNTQ